jgi:methylglutaconyl-CoA hydratase
MMRSNPIFEGNFESRSHTVGIFFNCFDCISSTFLLLFLNNAFVSLEYTRIKYNVANRVCSITLSRPEKHNAFDDTMVSELSAAFQAAQRDNEVKAIILNAEGDSFSSGADLAYLQKISKYDFDQNQKDSSNLMKLFLQIYTQRKPVIALVQGNALAGGCGLATVCDVVIAAKETARFGYTEVRIGFIPAIVMVFLIRRVGEAKARELALRGNIIGADEALNIGLVNLVVPAVQIEEAGEKLANELTTHCSGSSMGLVKELIARISGMSMNDALDYAANLNALTRMTDDCKKGIDSFLKKESVKWH